MNLLVNCCTVMKKGRSSEHELGIQFRTGVKLNQSFIVIS